MSGLIMDKSTLSQAGFSTIPFVGLEWENPFMADTKEILRSRLRERLDLTGKSMHAVSVAIGANAGYVRDLLDPAKTSIPSAERLRRLAGELGTTTDYLIGDASDPAQPISEASVRDALPDWRGANDKDGIPVLGTGYCDDLAIEGQDGELLIERIQLDLDHTVRMIHRPAALWAARDAYAIDLHGDSMHPALEQGSVRIVDPRRPPAPGEYVVAQLNDGNGGRDVVTVLVKKLVRATSTVVELQQFNPPITFRIPRSQVARLHRIVTYEELVGR